jgi:hypothetical protein
LDFPTIEVMAISMPTMLRNMLAMKSGAESPIFHGLGSFASCRRVKRATMLRTDFSSS